MTNDRLTDCPHCGQIGAVYTTQINEFHSSYLCLGCGYQTNDLMVDGEYNTEEYEAELPNLYIDAKKKDDKNRVWYPNVVNIPDKGTVFLNGTSVEDCQWSAILNVPLNKEDKKKAIFKGKTHKSDPSSLQNFVGDYLSALEYINVEL
jgi:DNA-directed RNA polymerase subunit RPC12/RpoP